MRALRLKKSAENVRHLYSQFDALNGLHPFMAALPNGYVPYLVRELDRGEVSYFNYPLAKEMGLLDQSHPTEMTAELHRVLLKTFSLQIINEYDQSIGKKFSTDLIKPHRYMASRYLQLQHANKKGVTSGDGRGIWNGVIHHQGRIWDVSSRGTGVTCLSPGAVEAARPLQTGGTEFGYGCGLAEIDELYSAAISAEVVHLQGIQTERVLCIIDLGNGHGIGVRAAQNLMRPAHIFLYLKQKRYSELKAAMDYFIDRQVQNGRWKPKTKGPSIYEELAAEMGRLFSNFTAQLEAHYIFAWLDWDGDNVLADAGIIDYGSVRQFGLRHDQYRYDDVERFSTNLNEQKNKARLMVQVFCQIADYLKTKKRKPLESFAKHPVVRSFSAQFKAAHQDLVLRQIGLNEAQRRKIQNCKPKLVQKFCALFDSLERRKVSGKTRKVPDGVNLPPLFDMHLFLREVTDQLFTQKSFVLLDGTFLIQKMYTRFSRSQDRSGFRSDAKKISELQLALIGLYQIVQDNKYNPKAFKDIRERTHRLNSEFRITGNAVIEIVDLILAERKRGAPAEAIQFWIDQLILGHLDQPEVSIGTHYNRGPRFAHRPDVLDKMMAIIAEHRQDI